MLAFFSHVVALLTTLWAVGRFEISRIFTGRTPGARSPSNYCFKLVNQLIMMNSDVDGNNVCKIIAVGS